MPWSCQPRPSGLPRESLIDHTIADLVCSQPQPHSPPPSVLAASVLDPDCVTSLFTKFSEMLDAGLTKVAVQITSDIKADLVGLGSRIVHMENKLETTVTRANQNTACIQSL